MIACMVSGGNGLALLTAMFTYKVSDGNVSTVKSNVYIIWSVMVMD